MLVISSVDYTHIGEYTCRATNSAGSVTYSVDLNVNGNQTLVTWEGTGYILRILTCIFIIYIQNHQGLLHSPLALQLLILGTLPK